MSTRARKDHRSRFVMIEAVLVAAVAVASPGLAGNDAVAFGVDNFGGSGECGTSTNGAKDTPYSVGTARAIDDVFDRWIACGDWDRSTVWTNKAVDDTDFTDASKKLWGNDNNDSLGMDLADVAFFMTHGLARSAGPGRSEFLMGDAAGNACQVGTDAHMLLGNGSGHDLEIVIASTCQSAQLEVWRGGGYDSLRTSSGSMQAWLGFHGGLVAGPFNKTNVKGHVEASYSNGLGENWLDRLYVWSDHALNLDTDLDFSAEDIEVLQVMIRRALASRAGDGNDHWSFHWPDLAAYNVTERNGIGGNVSNCQQGVDGTGSDTPGESGCEPALLQGFLFDVYRRFERNGLIRYVAPDRR